MAKLFKLSFMMALVVVALGAASGCAPEVEAESSPAPVQDENEWQTLSTPDLGFSVELPGSPEAGMDSLVSVIGRVVYIHRFIVDNGSEIMSSLRQVLSSPYPICPPSNVISSRHFDRSFRHQSR